MSPFLGTTGGGSSLGFRGLAFGGIGTDQSNPATSAKEIRDSGNTTNGHYWIKPTGYSGSAYQVYCLLSGGSSNRHHGGGWTLAMSFKNGVNRPWHLSQSWGNRSNDAYYQADNWGNFWTGASVENSTSAKPYSFQDRGEWSGQQDFSKDGRAIGMWQPFSDLMIMYMDSNESFNSPGATAWWTRNTSYSQTTLQDMWNSNSNQVWSTGGRQGMYVSGNLYPPVYNPDRSQEWTGDPVFMNNAVGNRTQGLSGYNLVINANGSSGTYKCNANENRSRITHTGMANNETGNNYPHVMNWGMGQYHEQGGWKGGALHCLGPASYCDVRCQHLPGGGSTDVDNATGYSDNNGSQSVFESGCRNTGSGSPYNNNQCNASHYGWALWVRES